MKTVLISLCLTLPALSQACMPEDLQGLTLSNLEENTNYDGMDSGESLTDKIYQSTIKISELTCTKSQMRSSYFNTKNSNEYQAVYSMEDECDGGNSYGAVFNAKEEMVALIQDGDFNCKN